MAPEELLPLYTKRYQQINYEATPLGRQYLAIDSVANTIDPWQKIVKQTPRPSLRVRNKLNTLWQNGAYLELARLMQFTPTKFSRSLTNKSRLSVTKLTFTPQITAYVYTVDSAPIKHVLGYIHGGGLLSGSALRTEDFLEYCSNQLASGWAIINFDYPYLTDTTLPRLITQLEQTITTWMAEFNTADLVLAGDSSGAYLVAQVASQISQHTPTLNLRGQALIYPQITIKPRPENTTSFTMDFTQLLNIQAALVNDTARIPLLSGATLIIQAQFDEFNAQIVNYISAQRAQGQTPLRVVNFKGMLHGFIDYFGYLPQAQLVADELVTWAQQVTKR